MKISSKVAQVLLTLAIFLMAYYDTKVTFHPKDASLNKMSLEVANGWLGHSAYRLLWFEMIDRKIVVRYNALLGAGKMQLYAITPKEKTVPVKLTSKRDIVKLNNEEYAGTFAAVLPSIKKDINGDGKLESVEFSAKLDTLFTQVKTALLDPGIPFEVVKGTNAVTVFLQQKPLANQKVRLIGQRGMDQMTATDAKGMIAIPDVRDLRQGILVVYQTPDHTWYITSYVQEAYTVFTKRHWIALLPLVKIIVYAGMLVGIFLLGRYGLASLHATKYAKKGRLYIVKNGTK
ncbi:MAG TPA: hypothetical protein VHY08_00440 [Bacillota bacterium]|nr:hypothetical protein [Bacillota bacterium]